MGAAYSWSGLDKQHAGQEQLIKVRIREAGGTHTARGIWYMLNLGLECESFLGDSVDNGDIFKYKQQGHS